MKGSLAVEDQGVLEFAPDACREQLRRIISNPDFDGTARDRNFLSYVIEEALAGRADRIKAYSIATEVFGRDASFDAQNDPIVRVQAGHLRRALERYYQGSGAGDPIEITIPRGGYAPNFAPRLQASPDPKPSIPEIERLPPSRRPIRWLWPGLAAIAAAAVLGALGLMNWMRAPGRAEPDIPRLLVHPLEDLSQSDASSAIARGLTAEIVEQLTRFKDIVVVVKPNAAGPAAAAPVGSEPSARFALTGSLKMSGEAFRLQVQVLDQARAEVVWAQSYLEDLKVPNAINVETQLAREVATRVAQPYGIIFHSDASRIVKNPPEDWEAYACTLRYYSYRADLDAATHPSIRKCLEQAVARYPLYATAWALLSQTYVDEVRFRYPIDPAASSASMDRALAAARRAVELDPDNVRALQAEMLAYYFGGNIEAALRIGALALAKNPNDAELKGEYGYRLALSGDWARGCSLVSEAHESNPGPKGYFESALALCAYSRGDFKQAYAWIRMNPSPSNPNYHLIAAIIFAEGGFDAEARVERDWILQNAHALVANLRREVAARVARQEDVDRFLKSLNKAGIVASD